MSGGSDGWTDSPSSTHRQGDTGLSRGMPRAVERPLPAWVCNITDIIHGFYNPTRLHSTLGYLPPNGYARKLK